MRLMQSNPHGDYNSPSWAQIWFINKKQLLRNAAKPPPLKVSSWWGHAIMKRKQLRKHIWFWIINVQNFIHLIYPLVHVQDCGELVQSWGKRWGGLVAIAVCKNHPYSVKVIVLQNTDISKPSHSFLSLVFISFRAFDLYFEFMTENIRGYGPECAGLDHHTDDQWLLKNRSNLPG